MSSRFSLQNIPAGATGVLLTDLDALVRNYEKLAELAAPAECAAVVKADGYGVGAGQVGRALAGAGCKTFFVATLAEGVRLRAELADTVIYVLDGLFPGSAGEFAGSNLRPVLGDLAEIDEWSEFCRSSQREMPAALHIDTGMNRLGLKTDGRKTIVSEPERLNGIPLSPIMSHLACADDPDDPKSEMQRADFVSVLANLPNAPASLANSAGIFHGKGFHFDLVRPGIALYGGNPFANRDNPMEPVIRLYGRVIQTGLAKAGETVGYGAMLKLDRDTHYAAVAIGYADGFFRALGSSNKYPGAVAYADGCPAPILGRVSMDLTVFDITDLPEGSVQRGGFLELIGDRFTVDDAARLAGTIGYEILTSLSTRYHRIYSGGGPPARGA